VDIGGATSRRRDIMLRVVVQRTAVDCGVAALSSYVPALSYEDVWQAVLALSRPGRALAGLQNRELLAVAASLGVSLTPSRTFDLDREHGVLRVRWQHQPRHGGHWVATKFGMIADPADGTVQPWRRYLERKAATPATLLRGSD